MDPAKGLRGEPAFYEVIETGVGAEVGLEELPVFVVEAAVFQEMVGGDQSVPWVADDREFIGAEKSCGAGGIKVAHGGLVPRAERVIQRVVDGDAGALRNVDEQDLGADGALVAVGLVFRVTAPECRELAGGEDPMPAVLQKERGAAGGVWLDLHGWLGGVLFRLCGG